MTQSIFLSTILAAPLLPVHTCKLEYVNLSPWVPSSPNPPPPPWKHNFYIVRIIWPSTANDIPCIGHLSIPGMLCSYPPAWSDLWSLIRTSGISVSYLYLFLCLCVVCVCVCVDSSFSSLRRSPTHPPPSLHPSPPPEIPQLVLPIFVRP